MGKNIAYCFIIFLCFLSFHKAKNVNNVDMPSKSLMCNACLDEMCNASSEQGLEVCHEEGKCFYGMFSNGTRLLGCGECPIPIKRCFECIYDLCNAENYIGNYSMILNMDCYVCKGESCNVNLKDMDTCSTQQGCHSGIYEKEPFKNCGYRNCLKPSAKINCTFCEKSFCNNGTRFIEEAKRLKEEEKKVLIEVAKGVKQFETVVQKDEASALEHIECYECSEEKCDVDEKILKKCRLSSKCFYGIYNFSEFRGCGDFCSKNVSKAKPREDYSCHICSVNLCNTNQDSGNVFGMRRKKSKKFEVKGFSNHLAHPRNPMNISHRNLQSRTRSYLVVLIIVTISISNIRRQQIY